MSLTIGEKIKTARKDAGYTQEQLAVMLTVSRQAITKWESDRGIPDIENLKNISKILNVSLDYLLNDSTNLDLKVIRESITLSGKNVISKAGEKEEIVRNRFANAEITPLIAEKTLTKSEKIVDNLLGFFTDAPFGIPAFLNSMKEVHNSYYLVEEETKGFLVIVSDDFIESHQLAGKIEDKKFNIGEYTFKKGKKLK